MKTTLTWLLAGAALVATAGGAIAHDAAAERAREEASLDARAGRHVHVYRSDAADEPRGPRKHIMIHRSSESREQHLKDVLQLRPDQGPALKAFLEATRRDAGDHRVVRFDRDAPGRSAAERLADMEAQADAHHAAMKTRIAATRTFYAQLDDRQKKAFDAMPLLIMAGPGFGPALIPLGHHMPPPPPPPAPPAPPAPPGDI